MNPAVGNIIYQSVGMPIHPHEVKDHAKRICNIFGCYKTTHSRTLLLIVSSLRQRPNENAPAACSAEATGMPEGKHDAGTKPLWRVQKTRQDFLSLRCAIPFKMITSLPAD